MASKVSGYIGKINPNNGTTQYSLGSTAYGYCETAAATAAKTVDMTGFTLIEGATIFIKFKYNNTATDDPTLNVQGTGAKPLIPKTWQPGAILSLTFDGTSWVEATTYSLNAAVNAGTASQIAYYSTNNTISGVGDTASPIYGLRYYHTNSSAHTPAALSRLHVYGVTYGNTADNMISGTAGLFSYGDGGPQITFSYSADGGQAGALIYTDNDAAGAGASWNFVTTESDWNVTSKRFHARTGISVGTNLPPRTTTPYPTDDYNLYVNGTSRFALGTSDNTSNKKFIIGSSGERYLSFGGAGVQAYNASDAISTLHLNYSGGPVYIGNGVSTSSTSSELRIKGRVIVDPYYHSTNSFSEFRVNRASNGWSGITLGGAKDSLSTTGLGIWLVGTKDTPGDATTEPANITDSQFYISYNGSNSAACRIQGHNATGFSIRPRLAINTDVNTTNYNHHLYVNGTAAISNTLYLTRTTDAGGTSTNKPALMIGALGSPIGEGSTDNPVGQHIEIDGNEILSKSDATTPGTLYLQDGTGSVNISGSGGLTITSLTGLRVVSTDSTKKLISTGHYASSSKMAINSTSEPSYNFYVNGSSFFYGQAIGNAASKEAFLVQHGTANKEAGFRAKRTDKTGDVWMGVGSGGVNHGLFSQTLNKWMIVANDSIVTVNGNAENVTGTVAIANGGTGATTAAAARANLGTLGAINANNYDGMATMAGATNTYIRTTQSGIIPYQSGGEGSGHCNIGTSSWRFANVYTDKINGFDTPLIQIVIRTGTGTNSWSVTFDFAPDFISVIGYTGINIPENWTSATQCNMAKVTTSWAPVRPLAIAGGSNGLVWQDLPGNLSPIEAKKSSNGKTFYEQVNSTAVSRLPSDIQVYYNTGLMGGPYRIFNTTNETYYILAIKCGNKTV